MALFLELKWIVLYILRNVFLGKYHPNEDFYHQLFLIKEQLVNTICIK